MPPSGSLAEASATWRPLIAIAGASKPSVHQKKAAFAVGQFIAQRGAPVVCGGMGGVMDEAAKGVASIDNAISIGLLPGFDFEGSSSALTIPITTGLEQVRNVVLARSCRTMIAIGGGFGTLSEIAFALRLRKPLALIDSWEFSHASIADDPYPLRIFVADKEAEPVVCAVAAIDWIFTQLGE